MEKLFCIQGNKPLKGEVKVSGSKNAALPILASTLISSGNNIIKNLPDISDVRHFLELLEYLGANISKNKEAVIINTDSVKIPDNFEINHYTIGKMRATVLLLAPILARFGEIKMNFPGGCVLGKRSFDAHLKFFENVGVEILNDKNYLHLK
ncbi:MAG: UDP-N-acetylglucosamine 1-carboxyvinyltransferase, partial [Candidatus Gracilibacteria bacterium]|nr:UDP-N-acetylglucosamine 1-carboxyvinyltransferase [Candidatus Gracilibacteria bacterium]